MIMSDDKWEESKEFLDGLSDEDMTKVVMNLKEEMKHLSVENMVFENFLQSHEPTLIAGMAKAMTILNEYQDQFMSSTSIKSTSADVKFDSQSTGENSEAQSMIGRRTGARTKGPRINYSQKTDLVMREYDEIQQHLKRFRDVSHKRMNRLKAEIEESGVRDNELKETSQNFEQQIVIEAVEKLTQKIPAEKFVRYMQEWLKSAQTMLEKMRLRTNSLCTQHRKLKALLLQKEDMGECVHEVDFEKLGIENRNFLTKIEQKNINLLELKQINGKANLMLTTHKNFLHKQDEYMRKILAQRKLVLKQIESLKTQFDQTEIELGKDRAKHDSVKNIIAKYQVPDVMEYILKKNELHEHKKQLKVWKRKVNIQKIVMHTYAKIMCQLKNCSKPRPEWYTEKNMEWEDEEEPDSSEDATVNHFKTQSKRKLISRSLSSVKK